LHADGSFHASIGGFDPSQEVCISVVRRQRMNMFTLNCARIASGGQRVDFSAADLPPGLIRIDVPSSPESTIGFATLAVGKAGTGVFEYLTSFKPERGYRGEFMARNGSYDVVLQSPDRKVVFATAAVPISPEHPVQDVTLTLSR
jgi:hypothetical protein